MNKSITAIAVNTSDERVRELTRQLYLYAGKRVRATFVKKNGEHRTMEFVPNFQYNKTLGIETTDAGKRMVISKTAKDMVTVAEIVNGTTLQARTLNLRTVIGDITPVAA